MGKIQVAVVNVEGDGEIIKEVLRMAGDLIDNRGRSSAVIDVAAPAATLPAPATGRQVPCKHCAQSFASIGKLIAHSRREHPKNKKSEPTAAPAAKATENKDGTLWCPIKNCGAHFSKKGWLNIHLDRAHGIKDGIH